MGRPPEYPTWTVMWSPDKAVYDPVTGALDLESGEVLRVRAIYADEKLPLGWLMIARESDLLPWPVSRPVNVQSNPRRFTAYDDGEDPA